MNRQNQPGAGIADRNAPHSTLQLGMHSHQQEFYSRQELRGILREKAKRAFDQIRLYDRDKDRKLRLSKQGRKWAEDEMFTRWLAQIKKACAKESLSTRYPVDIVDRVMSMQNVHDDVVKEAFGR